MIHWYHNKFGYCWHDPLSHTELSPSPAPFHYYPDSYISVTVSALSTILSSLLPTMSMFALYYIHNSLARIGAIIAFTFLFSVVLTLITNAKRVECFAAASAFAALQVVFVGSVNWK